MFSRSVIKLGSNFDSNGYSNATVRGVHLLLWTVMLAARRFRVDHQLRAEPDGYDVDPPLRPD